MRFKLSYNLYRFIGITGLFLVLCFVVVRVFGGVDVTGVLPVGLARDIQEGWPEMPFFSSQKQPTGDGGEVIYYTVPTRQITPEELARMQKKQPANSATTAPATSTQTAH